MLPQFPADLERVLLVGLLVTIAIWLILSLYVIANRVLYNRRAQRLSAVATQVEARGLSRTLREASSHRGNGKWRRISALSALAHVRAPETHELLERALFDGDPEVASAVIVILRRLGDRRAAEILIAGLRARAYQPSRIATQLDQFATPIDDLLRPLLVDSEALARYWAVSLLARYPSLEFADEIAALGDDTDAPVRKAVLYTLAAVRASAVPPIARRRLSDPVSYVRSAAVRSLAQAGAASANEDAQREYAFHIAPLLGDREWDVRFAAKESLVTLGPAVWREVSSQLDSADKFARNGAAEVLQNIGLLDRLIDELGHGVAPNADVVSVLERTFREGGAGMIDAAAARSDHQLYPTIENLLTRLRFVGVRISA